MSNLIDVADVPVIDVWGESVRARRVEGERVTLALIELAPDSIVPGHRHDNEQLGMVITGSVTFTVGDETRELGPGGTWRIPPTRRTRSASAPRERSSSMSSRRSETTGMRSRASHRPRPPGLPGTERSSRVGPGARNSPGTGATNADPAFGEPKAIRQHLEDNATNPKSRAVIALSRSKPVTVDSQKRHGRYRTRAAADGRGVEPIRRKSAGTRRSVTSGAPGTGRAGPPAGPSAGALGQQLLAGACDPRAGRGHRGLDDGRGPRAAACGGARGARPGRIRPTPTPRTTPRSRRSPTPMTPSRWSRSSRRRCPGRRSRSRAGTAMAC